MKPLVINKYESATIGYMNMQLLVINEYVTIDLNEYEYETMGY